MPTPTQIVTSHRPDLTPYETLYKHFHARPELSNQESETAATIASHLATLSLDFAIHAHIGGHGLAAVLSNGSSGPTILLRADMDALPVEEATGLSYASRRRMRDAEGVEKPVMHACGHDVHVTALLAAADLLVRAREEWSGRVVLCFQPAEERGTGAQAMVEGGLYEKVGGLPDVVLGGHVMPYRAGTISLRKNLMASSADSLHITLHGRGSHASQPHRSIDPVVMAASAVTRLQTIVSREVAPDDLAVVTVGSIVAGDAENVIPGSAVMKVDTRAINASTRERVLKSVERIVRAECDASGAPKQPEFRKTREFPLMFNDEKIVDRLTAIFAEHFQELPQHFARDGPRLGGSEDFAILGTSIERPCCFWVYGGTDPEVWDQLEKEGRLDELPINHSPLFAPVLQPTLRVAVDAYALGALTYLMKQSS
ncbi:MAG: hypothetical protein Q9165_007181 [Trypethelium subeluteriae]